MYWGAQDMSSYELLEHHENRIISILQGLKRIEDDPEIYPATADEWADIVPGDEGEIAVVRPLLAGTSLQAAPLRLAYNADKDGWNADSFHAKVNTYGAALVVAQTTGGAILGGYNPLGV
jgi:hypothetical protein